MIRHLLRLFWSRKNANILLLLEIFISFIVLFTVCMVAIVFIGRYSHPLGFKYDNVYSVDLDMLRGMDETEDSMQMDFEICVRMIHELEAMTEIIAVASVFPNPYGMTTSTEELEYADQTLGGRVCTASDRAAEVLDIEILQGRWFDESDDALDIEPIVINKLMAEQLIPDEDPVGKKVGENNEYRVVGVIEDFRYGGELTKVKPFYFKRQSFQKSGDERLVHLALKVQPGTTAEFEERALSLIRDIEPEWSLGIKQMSLMRATNLKLTMSPIILGFLVAGFLMIMVMLGMIGVFWQSITSRTNEIGLRRALGCPRSEIYGQLLMEIILLTTVGCGLAAILLLQLPILGIFASISWINVIISLAIAALFMFALAVISGLFPAWMASQVHPAEALHYE
ncbi:MAG: ABC transporter permease [Candidatus Electryonea clarkiae]|nr:ABC transporter permease [Candidatus Electryonea clarkiae]MDP8286007.1 ABC transporter permease [Candidatus Electryonea clarkiae]